MDGACGSVSLDRYWNYVATPFLFTILGFGMYTLFGMNEMQMVGRSYVMKQVDKISLAMGSDSAPPPPPPPPSPQELKAVAGAEAAAIAKEGLTPNTGKQIAANTNAAVDKRRKAAEAAGRQSNAAAAAPPAKQ